MNKAISFNRIYHLIKKDLIQISRFILVPTGIIMGIIILADFIHALINFRMPIKRECSLDLLMLGGIIAASFAFNELHNKDKCDDYILLPASVIEKTMSRLLVTAVIIPVYIFFLIILSSAIGWFINFVVFNFSGGFCNPIEGTDFSNFMTYLVLQQIAFLGGAWFKKLHLVKTILVCIGLFFIYSILAIVFLDIILPNDSYNGVFGIVDTIEFLTSRMHVLQTFLKIFFIGIIPLFCWVVAWMRVREVQSHYGI